MATSTIPYTPLTTDRLLLQPLTPQLCSVYEDVASKRVEVVMKKPEVPTMSDWLVPHQSIPPPRPAGPSSTSRFSKLKSLFEDKSQASHDGSTSGSHAQTNAVTKQEQQPECKTKKKMVPFETVAYSSKNPDRRAYIIHLQHSEKPMIVGIVTLTGRLLPIGLMRDDDIGPRQFRWDVDVFVLEEFRRQGIAAEAGATAMKSLVDSDLDILIGHRARLAKPGSEEGSNPHYSSGRQVSFEAVVDEGNIAGIKLATKLDMKEIGWTMSATGKGVIRSRRILDWVREAKVDGEYRVTRTEWKITASAEGMAHGATAASSVIAGGAQDGEAKSNDPEGNGKKRSQYWEPQLISTDRLFLLPLTTRFELAWNAIQGHCQLQANDYASTRLEDVIYDAQNRDRRAYAVFLPEDLMGIPSNMVPLESQQERCIGILKMVGRLCQVSQDTGESTKTRFEWHLSVFIIPSHKGNGYASESLVAALEGLKKEDDDVRGWEGLGDNIVVYADIVGDAKVVASEEKVLKELGVDFERDIGEGGSQKTRLAIDMLDGKMF